MRFKGKLLGLLRGGLGFDGLRFGEGGLLGKEVLKLSVSFPVGAEEILHLLSRLQVVIVNRIGVLKVVNLANAIEVGEYGLFLIDLLSEGLVDDLGEVVGNADAKMLHDFAVLFAPLLSHEGFFGEVKIFCNLCVAKVCTFHLRLCKRS